MDISFCPICSKQIRSAFAYKLWQKICYQSIPKNGGKKLLWVNVESDYLDQYLRILELKNFIITTDVHNVIWAAPQDAYEYEGTLYFCTDRAHFQRVVK